MVGNFSNPKDFLPIFLLIVSKYQFPQLSPNPLHYASLLTSSFGLNLLSHFSFQANMDGNKAELVHFEKFKGFFCYVKQELR